MVGLWILAGTFHRLYEEMGRMDEAYKVQWLKQAKFHMLISAACSVVSLAGLWRLLFRGDVKAGNKAGHFNGFDPKEGG